MSDSPKVPPFTQSELLALAEALAEASTHSLLPGLFHEASLVEGRDIEGLSKPKRIFNAIADKQRQTGTGNFAIKCTGYSRNLAGDSPGHWLPAGSVIYQFPTTTYVLQYQTAVGGELGQHWKKSCSDRYAAANPCGPRCSQSSGHLIF